MRLVRLLPLVVVSVSGFAGCVGDDPRGAVPRVDGSSSGGVSSSGEPGSSSSGGASSGGASSGGASSGGVGSSSGSLVEPDAGPPCAIGTAVGGICQPVTLRANLLSPYGIAVTEAGGYTTAVWVRGAPNATGAVERCQAASCESSVESIATITGALGSEGYPAGAHTIVTDGTTVRWIARGFEGGGGGYPARDVGDVCTLFGRCIPDHSVQLHAGPHAVAQLALSAGAFFLRSSIGEIEACAMDSCATFDSPRVLAGDAYRRSLAVSDTRIAYFDSANTVLQSCVRSGRTCTMQDPPAPVSYGNPKPALLELSGDLLVGATENIVFTCTAGNCAPSARKLIEGQATVTALATDGTHAYWTTRGNGGATGELLTCPVAGCAAGPPRVVARNLADPRSMTIHAGVLYWVNYGVDGVGGSLQAVSL